MKAQLEELISKISSGCMLAQSPNMTGHTQTGNAAKNFEQKQQRLAEGSAQPVMLSGAEMLVQALTDEGVEYIFGYPGGAVLHIYDALFQQIVESFGPEVSFVLKAKQLAKVEPLKALNRIQVQLASLSPETQGYVLLNFSEPLDDELQAVLVYSTDLPRVMALAVEVGIYAAPAYEALKAAQNEE